LSIVHVPFAAVRANHPVAPLRVLDHQDAQSGFELLARDAPRGKLTFEAKILVLCSLERIRGLHGFLLLGHMVAWSPSRMVK
jgi:hypothetical protein